MKNKVRSLAAHKGDGKAMQPIEALHEALSDIEKDLVQPSKLVVVMLEDHDGQYTTRFVQAGMKMSELVALLEIAKNNIITDQMG